jgi:hypothetical protein
VIWCRNLACFRRRQFSLAFYAPESLERPSDEAYAAINALQEFWQSRIAFSKKGWVSPLTG